MEENPKVGQRWRFNHLPGRIIRVNACDDERKMVTDHEDVGPHRTKNRRQISYLTLQECWTLLAEDALITLAVPEPANDGRLLCELKRHALYVMRYPSERRKGRIIELLQWSDNEIPGEGRGYRDHGTPSRQQKAMATALFQERWVKAADHADQLPEYLLAGRPLTGSEPIPTGRKLTARTPQQEDAKAAELLSVIEDLKQRLAQRDKSDEAVTQKFAALQEQIRTLNEVVMAKVVPISSKRRKRA